jgi:hypothetical protein
MNCEPVRIPHPFALGFIAGFVPGVAVGIALDSLPVGIAIGMGNGLVFANIVSALAEEGEGDRWIRLTPATRRYLAVVLLLGILFFVAVIIALFLLV